MSQFILLNSCWNYRLLHNKKVIIAASVFFCGETELSYTKMNACRVLEDYLQRMWLSLIYPLLLTSDFIDDWNGSCEWPTVFKDILPIFDNFAIFFACRYLLKEWSSITKKNHANLGRYHTLVTECACVIINHTAATIAAFTSAMKNWIYIGSIRMSHLLITLRRGEILSVPVADIVFISYTIRNNNVWGWITSITFISKI